MCSATAKQADDQQISWHWLRAAGIGERCARLGRIPIRPVLAAEPDFLACCDVRRNQTIHRIPTELRKLRVRVKDEKRVAGAGGDQRSGCDERAVFVAYSCIKRKQRKTTAGMQGSKYLIGR